MQPARWRLISLTDTTIPRQQSREELERAWWRYHYGVDNAEQWLARYPFADDDAAHQIRITYSTTQTHLCVTCTCGKWRDRVSFGDKAAETAVELFREHLACP